MTLSGTMLFTFVLSCALAIIVLAFMGIRHVIRKMNHVN